MKIVILGAGQVGSTLAENLAREAHDITVVDASRSALNNLQERLDIRTVQGQHLALDVFPIRRRRAIEPAVKADQIGRAHV